MSVCNDHSEFFQSKAPFQIVALTAGIDDVVWTVAAVPTSWLEMVAGLFGTRQLSVAVEAPEATSTSHTFLRMAPVISVQGSLKLRQAKQRLRQYARGFLQCQNRWGLVGWGLSRRYEHGHSCS